MWPLKLLQTSGNFDQLVASCLPTGLDIETANAFVSRWKSSRERLILISQKIDRFFTEEVNSGEIPDGVRIAILAAGSAARLELWKQLSSGDYAADDRALVREPMSPSGGQGEEVTKGSDIDLLCVCDGWEEGEESEATKLDLMQRLTDWLQADASSGALLGESFDPVWLDSMSTPPYGDFRSYAVIANSSFRKVLTEDRRIEVWRYWLVFESVPLFEYPAGQGFEVAKNLEEELARTFFGLDPALEQTRFPFLWYHASCRYLSEIYLGTIRKILTKADRLGDLNSEEAVRTQEEMMDSVIKLKAIRVLNWALAITSAIIVYYIGIVSKKSQRERGEVYRLVRGSGLIPSLKLQRMMIEATDGLVGGSWSDEKLKEYVELNKFARFLDSTHVTILETYGKYFEWKEGTEPLGHFEVEDVFGFLEGRTCPNVPVTKYVAELIRVASEMWKVFQGRVRSHGGFVPDFLF